MKEILDLYKTARGKAYHTEGLIAIYLILAIILGFLKFNPISSGMNVLLVVALVIIIQGSWHLSRRVPTFRLGQMGILFSPHGDEDVAKDLDLLHGELVARLKNNPHCGKFVLKILPPNRIVTDVDTAMMIRRRSKCMLLIWGRYERGRLNNKELRGFAVGKLNFTYAYPNVMDAAVVSKDIEVGVANRAWMFSSENELLEREFLISNIFDVARYIVGTCLLLFGNVNDGKELLIDIVRSPSSPAWLNGANRVIGNFLENIKAKISRADALIANAIYSKEIFVNGRFNRDNKRLQDIVRITEASINNRPNADAYLLKAIANFLLGDVLRAKKAMSQLRRREPQNHSACYSLGFLCAYCGDMDRAESYYKKGFAATFNVTAEYVFHLSEFVETVLGEEPEKIQLHYVLGMIHRELIDLSLARCHFEKFIMLASGKPELQQWVSKAGSILGDLKKDLGQGVEALAAI